MGHASDPECYITLYQEYSWKHVFCTCELQSLLFCILMKNSSGPQSLMKAMSENPFLCSYQAFPLTHFKSQFQASCWSLKKWQKHFSLGRSQLDLALKGRYKMLRFAFPSFLAMLSFPMWGVFLNRVLNILLTQSFDFWSWNQPSVWAHHRSIASGSTGVHSLGQGSQCILYNYSQMAL